MTCRISYFKLSSPLFRIDCRFITIRITDATVKVNGSRRFFCSRLSSDRRRAASSATREVKGSNANVLCGLCISIIGPRDNKRRFYRTNVRAKGSNSFLVEVLIDSVLFMSPILGRLFIRFGGFFWRGRGQVLL